MAEGVHNKLQTGGWDTLDALLYHVVAVLVFNALEDTAGQLRNKRLLRMHAWNGYSRQLWLWLWLWLWWGKGG